MKADLRGPKDLGTVIGLAYRVYAANFRVFFLIALITVPLQMLAAVVTDRAESATADLLMIPIQLAQLAVFLIATGALIHAVNLVAAGTPVEPGAALDAAFERFVALLTTNLLFTILLIASIAGFPYTAYRYLRDVARVEGRGALAVLGLPLGMFLFFWLRWLFQAQGVMIEGKRNWAALDESSAAVQGQWWRTLAIMLVALLVASGPALIAGSAAVVLPVLAAATVVSAIVAFVIPFLVIAQTLLYFDLKARKQTDVRTD